MVVCTVWYGQYCSSESEVPVETFSNAVLDGAISLDGLRLRVLPTDAVYTLSGSESILTKPEDG